MKLTCLRGGARRCRLRGAPVSCVPLSVPPRRKMRTSPAFTTDSAQPSPDFCDSLSDLARLVEHSSRPAPHTASLVPFSVQQPAEASGSRLLVCHDYKVSSRTTLLSASWSLVAEQADGAPPHRAATPTPKRSSSGITLSIGGTSHTPTSSEYDLDQTQANHARPALTPSPLTATPSQLLAPPRLLSSHSLGPHSPPPQHQNSRHPHL